MKIRAIILPAALVYATSLFAQEDSRTAEIAEQQARKATQLVPVEQNRIERALLWFREQAIIERYLAGVHGFRPKVGGMAPESGIGAGSEYRWAGAPLKLRTSAVFSNRGARMLDLQIAAPSLGNSRFFAQIDAVHHNYPRLSFYGEGPDSERRERSRFRLEDVALDATIGYRPFRNFSIGTSAGYVWNHADPGLESRYRRIAGFAQYDWRDNPGGPRRGGNYFTQLSDYRDFQRLDMEAQQYLSILNQRRVFAVRARSSLLFHDRNRPVPFYMLPSLGGSEDLRGYRPYRFRGDNSFVMNAEYRWEVFSGLDMALFGDAGKVFNRRSDFDLHHLESNVGFGFRFNARNQTFLRLDTAFSHEGFQVWIKFSNIFQGGPVHTSSIMGTF